MMRSNYHHARLYDVDNSAYVANGTAEYAGSGDTVQTSSLIDHVFTITSSTEYRIQSYPAAGQGGDGMGVQANNPSDSTTINLNVTIQKLK